MTDPVKLARLAIDEHEAWQKPAELAPLAALVAELRPQRVLEIGTHKGGTMWLWSQLATDDAVLVTVDLDHSRVSQRLVRAQQRIAFVEGDSLMTDTKLRVERQFGRDSIDFLFIDGAHSYMAAITDWQAYRPLVRDGGMVVLHDIREADGSEVDQLWAELAEEHRPRCPVVEIVATDTSRWGGLGVIYV